MNMQQFVTTIRQMRKFCLWVRRVEEAGLDLGNDFVDSASQALHFLLTDGNPSWDYDAKENHHWIIEYTGDPEFDKKYSSYTREGETWNLSDPVVLYCFLCYMNGNNRLTISE